MKHNEVLSIERAKELNHTGETPCVTTLALASLAGVSHSKVLSGARKSLLQRREMGDIIQVNYLEGETIGYTLLLSPGQAVAVLLKLTSDVKVLQALQGRIQKSLRLLGKEDLVRYALKLSFER